MSDFIYKLNLCRVHLSESILDLMDFVEGQGYVEPSDKRLLIIYNTINFIVDSIDLLSDKL